MKIIGIVPTGWAADSPKDASRVEAAMAADPYWGHY